MFTIFLMTCKFDKYHLSCEEKSPHESNDRPYFVHLMVSYSFHSVQFKDKHVVHFESEENFEQNACGNYSKHENARNSKRGEEIFFFVIVFLDSIWDNECET